MLKANEKVECTARISDHCDGSIIITEEEVKGATDAYYSGHKYIMRKWALNYNYGVMCPKCLDMAHGLWMEICDG